MVSTKENFWKDRSRAELIALEVESIHEQHRDTPELMQSKWFDYRMMLPAEATYLFASIYKNEYIAAYKRTVDIRTADMIRAFAPDDIFKSRDLTSMWLARQAADQIGVQYEFFIRYVFERFATRGWKNIPRPNQLYAEEILLDVKDAWEARCREIMQLAKHPFYFEDAYVGHPYQREYHAFVVAQINQRPQRHYALARALREGALPQAVAIESFGESVYERALSS